MHISLCIGQLNMEIYHAAMHFAGCLRITEVDFDLSFPIFLTAIVGVPAIPQIEAGHPGLKRDQIFFLRIVHKQIFAVLLVAILFKAQLRRDLKNVVLKSCSLILLMSKHAIASLTQRLYSVYIIAYSAVKNSNPPL